MGKLTELPQALSFDEGDILVKDGANGTKKISIEKVLEYMVDPALTTPGKAADAKATKDAIDAVDGEVNKVKTQIINDNIHLTSGDVDQASVSNQGQIVASTTRLKTKDPLPHEIIKIDVAENYLIQLALFDLDNNFLGFFGENSIKDDFDWVYVPINVQDVPNLDDKVLYLLIRKAGNVEIEASEASSAVSLTESVIEKNRIISNLSADIIPNSDSETTFLDGKPNKITFYENNSKIRIDTFTFASQAITEVRTGYGHTLTITTNLSNLETGVVYR